jgi:hypothetical protein
VTAAGPLANALVLPHSPTGAILAIAFYLVVSCVVASSRAEPQPQMSTCSPSPELAFLSDYSPTSRRANWRKHSTPFTLTDHRKSSHPTNLTTHRLGQNPSLAD